MAWICCQKWNQSPYQLRFNDQIDLVRSDQIQLWDGGIGMRESVLLHFVRSRAAADVVEGFLEN